MLVSTELAVFLLEDITAHKQLYMVIGQYKVESRDSLPVTQVTKDNRHWQLPESYLSLPYTEVTPLAFLTLAKLHVHVLPSFIEFNKALTKFNEACIKPYHGLIEVLL